MSSSLSTFIDVVAYSYVDDDNDTEEEDEEDLARLDVITDDDDDDDVIELVVGIELPLL